MVTREQVEYVCKVAQPACVRDRDISGYASLFTSDAVWWPLGRRTRVGPLEIAAGFAEVTAGVHIEASFEIEQVLVSEHVTLAALRGTEIIECDGKPRQVVHSREIWLFREELGQAKICRMTWNTA